MLSEHVGHVAVSLAAELQGEIKGHILFNPVTIEMTDDSKEVLSLAPGALDSVVGTVVNPPPFQMFE